MNLNITNIIQKKACHKLQVIAKYQHINEKHMNSLKERIPKKSKPIKPHFPAYPPNQTAENIPYGNNLSKSVFFACAICEGSLVPATICILCKRTALRECTKCKKTFEFNDHESCKNLIYFGSVIINKKIVKESR